MNGQAFAAQVHNVIKCTIYNERGEVIRAFPGRPCLFLPDGSFVSSQTPKLVFYGPDGSKKWEKPYATHHQLALSNDGKNILVMTYSVHEYKGMRIAFDRLVVLDLSGKLLKSFDFYDYREEINELGRKDRKGLLHTFGKSPLPGKDKNLKWEFTHANTFYEISENATGKKNSLFQSGNYLVNINGAHNVIFVLNDKLDKILWSSKSIILSWGFHDVQMQPNGWLLIYDNKASYTGAEREYTAIFELNPLTGERRLVYRADPPESMYSQYNGSAQRLENGNLLFSDYSDGGMAIEVNPAGKRVWSMRGPGKEDATGRPPSFQQVKRYDLSSFLKNNKGF